MNAEEKKKFRQKMAHMSMFQIKELANRTHNPSSKDKVRLNKWMESPDYQAIKENDTPGSTSDPHEDADEAITKYLPKINQHLARIEQLLKKLNQQK